jgi:hypothetical protein
MAPTSNAGSVESTTEAGDNISVNHLADEIFNAQVSVDERIRAFDAAVWEDIRMTSMGVEAEDDGSPRPKFKIGDYALVQLPTIEDGKLAKFLVKMTSVDWLQESWVYTTQSTSFDGVRVFQEDLLEGLPYRIGSRRLVQARPSWGNDFATNRGIATVIAIRQNHCHPGDVEYVVDWRAISGLSAESFKTLDMTSIASPRPTKLG